MKREARLRGPWVLGIGSCALALLGSSAIVFAAKNLSVDAKELRATQLGEVGADRAPPRVVTTFSLPGDKSVFGIACARKAGTENPAHCGVFDAQGKLLDASVGLNVMRVKAKGGEKLELLFAAQWDKMHVRVAALGSLDPAFIDSVSKAFVADLSMIEFMSVEEGFPIGVSLDAGVKEAGDKFVFGDGGELARSALVSELRKAPAPLPPLEVPVAEAVDAPGGDADGAQPQTPPAG